jgi:ubiquinone/menaquinone biosynthesis C-methylase UbiE
MRGVGRLRWYDAFAWWARMPAAYAEIVTRIAPAAGQRVLEIGCGTGNLLLRVLTAAPVTGIGFDPDPRALRTLRRKAGRAHVLVATDVGVATALPYADGSLDQVLSALMFHHVDPADRSVVLAEVRRVLAPGGRFHLVDLDADPHHASDRSTGRRPGPRRRIARHHVVEADLPGTLRAAGFEVTVHPSLSTRIGRLAHVEGR